MKKILLIFVFIATSIVSYGQTHCNLFIDDLETGDTLKITSNFWSNRRHQSQDISVFKNSEGKYFAFLSNDTIKNSKVELNKAKIDIIKKFEIGVRSQKLEGDEIIVHTLAEYELKFRYGRYYYGTKEIFYDLFKELW